MKDMHLINNDVIRNNSPLPIRTFDSVIVAADAQNFFDEEIKKDLLRDRKNFGGHSVNL